MGYRFSELDIRKIMKALLILGDSDKIHMNIIEVQQHIIIAAMKLMVNLIDMIVDENEEIKADLETKQSKNRISIFIKKCATFINFISDTIVGLTKFCNVINDKKNENKILISNVVESITSENFSNISRVIIEELNTSNSTLRNVVQSMVFIVLERFLNNILKGETEIKIEDYFDKR